MSIKNTSLCYLERDHSYLMMHRIKKEQDVNAGKWIGVGGKFEDKESPEDCVLREVLEETGFVIQPASLRYRGIITFITDHYDTELMHLFTCTEFSPSRPDAPECPDCSEGVLQWVPKSQISSLKLWEGDRIFLSLLEKEQPFFSLKLVYSGKGDEEKLVQAILNGWQNLL